MLTRSYTTGRYDAVWREAEPYMRARKNDVHIPLSFAFAQALLKLHPDADEDIVSLAILLHDIGWWSIDMTDIIEKGFGPNMMQSDVRFLHEKEGVRLSREVLANTGWPEPVIAAVGEIIDGHDTRPYPRRSTTGWCAMPTSSGALRSRVSPWPATGSSSIPPIYRSP